MKIKQETIDLPEKVWKAFATKYCNWSETVFTTTESPNYEIANPFTWQEAIQAKYHEPILNDIADFKLQQAKLEAQIIIDKANSDLNAANDVALEQASQIISFIVE